MRGGAGVLAGDISNRLGQPFSRPMGTAGRSFRDDASHTTFGELEGIMEKERAKFRQAKDKLESELDSERKVRIEFQNKLIKLKDEFSRKDVELSEVQFRENNIGHQIQDYQLENDKLKTEIMRMEELYGNRVFELEAELTTDRRQHEEVLQEYKSEFQKFKKEGLEYIESLNFEHDRKVKGLEEKAKTLENVKKQLTIENKKLNDHVVQSKLMFEEEIRDLTNRLRDDEMRKGQFMAKSFEQRIKSVEDSKEALNRRIQDLARQLQDKDRQLQEFQNERNDEMEKMRLDNSDLSAKCSQMNFLFEKVKNELQQKDAVMNRHSGESSQEVQYLKQQLEQKRKEIELLNATIRELRQNVKDISVESERKRTEVLDKCSFFEAQARRYKEQNTNIYDTLKAKINQTITNVGTKR